MDWFIRDDTYAKALAQLTHFQMSNPFAYHWGAGTHSSSDAQYFPTGNFQSALTSRNPYYGKESGIAFYTHVADQHSPFFTQVILTRIREAPYMLNGLLHTKLSLIFINMPRIPKASPITFLHSVPSSVSVLHRVFVLQ